MRLARPNRESTGTTTKRQMPPMSKTLMDAIKDFESYRTRKADEMARLNERLASLIRSREESLKVVELDNGNDEARMRLDAADKDIAALKKNLANLQKQISSDILAMRSEILAKHEQTLAQLDAHLQRKHAEQAHLKNEKIPEAEKHLASLKEQLARTQDEIARVQKDIDQTNQINFDLLLQSQEKA